MNEKQKKLIRKILQFETLLEQLLNEEDMQSEELQDIKTDLKYYYTLLKSETP